MFLCCAEEYVKPIQLTVKHVAIVETMPWQDKEPGLGKYVDTHMIVNLVGSLTDEGFTVHRLPVSVLSDDVLLRAVDENDYFIFAGGEDIDPYFYGQMPEDPTHVFFRDVDRKQILMVEEVLKQGKKILGICRGLQLLNIVGGGTLIQSLPEGGHFRRSLLVPGRFVSHSVRTSPGSFIHQALGIESDVLSAHHQAAGELGVGYIPTAYSHDGVVEAMEHQNGRILAVQFHAEDTGVFQSQLRPLIHFLETGQR